mgnify:CR=1 FL=1
MVLGRGLEGWVAFGNSQTIKDLSGLGQGLSKEKVKDAFRGQQAVETN